MLLKQSARPHSKHTQRSSIAFCFIRFDLSCFALRFVVYFAHLDSTQLKAKRSKRSRTELAKVAQIFVADREGGDSIAGAAVDWKLSLAIKVKEEGKGEEGEGS